MRKVSFAVAVTAVGALAFSAPAATPAVGTAAESTDLAAVEGAEPYGDGYAIPLEAARPDWLTDELLDEVAAAGGPVAAPSSATADLPLSGSVGIRPGSWMVSPAGCTMNFVFSNGSDLAIGTAGHCVEGESGPGKGNGGGKDGGKGKSGDDGGTAGSGGATSEPIVLLTVAPGGSNPVLIELGPVLVYRNDGIGDDFALVAIPDQYADWVFPTIAQVGGPCGVYEGSGPETVGHYGHGVAIGTGGTPRAGVALNWREDAFGWNGAAIFGDSGSAVRTTMLAAAGDLTHLVVDPKWLPATIAGTRATRIEQLTGSYDIVDSPYCP